MKINTNIVFANHSASIYLQNLREKPNQTIIDYDLVNELEHYDIIQNILLYTNTLISSNDIYII